MKMYLCQVRSSAKHFSVETLRMQILLHDIDRQESYD